MRIDNIGKMVRHLRFYATLFLLSGTLIPVCAQEDDSDAAGEPQEAIMFKKKTVAKGPQYPMMEIKGKVFDAVSKAPLPGVQVQALNNNRYTAMTEEDGSFVISVPTFETSLFVHSPEYMSEQVAIDKHGPMVIRMHSDKFGAMYKNSTNILAAPSYTELNTASKSIEPDIQSNLGADVRAIGRSGEPGGGAAMFIRGLNSLNAERTATRGYRRCALRYADHSHVAPSGRLYEPDAQHQPRGHR